MQQRLTPMTWSGLCNIYCLYILLKFVKALHILLYCDFQPTTTFATRQWLCFFLNKLPERELRECGISGCLYSIVSYFPAMRSSFPNSHFPISPFIPVSSLCLLLFPTEHPFELYSHLNSYLLFFTPSRSPHCVPSSICMFFWVLRI